ncbi:MAG: AzlD domain-containing protein [Elusimicrobiota bacterium]|nr:MAG: AzlD domain-containing protein [Elusimicrobiota bacterium]
MSVWGIFALGGLFTFATRFSFIYALGRVRIPPALHRALRFVPPAVLSAIIFPEVLMTDGRLDAGLGNHRMLAAAVALAVAARTKKVLPTIAAGMAALLLLSRLG